MSYHHILRIMQLFSHYTTFLLQTIMFYTVHLMCLVILIVLLLNLLIVNRSLTLFLLLREYVLLQFLLFLLGGLVFLIGLFGRNSYLGPLVIVLVGPLSLKIHSKSFTLIILPILPIGLSDFELVHQWIL